ncbi:MAG: hypothetical protein AABW89_01585 [Nanoarchaeota archaeon]
MERTQITVKISDEALQRAISLLEFSGARTELLGGEIKGDIYEEVLDRTRLLIRACEKSTRNIDYSIIVH